MTIPATSEKRSAPARPTAVSVLGWFWVRLGGVSLLVSPCVLILSLVLAHKAPGGRFPPPANFPPGLGPLEWVFAHFTAVLALQAALSAVTLYAALQFLKLRPWSRAYFEAVSWLGLAGALCFGVYWPRLWSGMMANVARSATSRPMLGALQAVGVAAPFILLAIPCLFIWLLRSRHVRPAFSSGSPGSNISGYNPGP